MIKRVITSKSCGWSDPIWTKILQVIKDKCYNRLHTCYTGDELDYHMAFLLEDLKITGVTISDRLIPEVAENDLENQSDDKPIVEVAECPMFQNLYTDSSTVTG